ncbi:alpha/beta fold hydrolase [Sphingomonas sp. BK235]|uniref:alpha/beta fold hydrolase n=1 Tax=Sphingomonas sp. BK235 TaxID=2512131 RepID=UPI00104FD1E9|nr:alpha/beta fold hydrolase [Sphingomonas sp. BK235]
MIAGPGSDLFVRSWPPIESAKAILAICPGFNSHSGYYGWVGEQCAAAGLATYAVDLRGRGRSRGERFYVESFDDYVADLATLVAHARTNRPGLPLFVLGHSAGGVIACLYALHHGGDLAGLMCEDLAFEVPAPDLALTILKGLSHVAPHARSIRLKNGDFSRDPAVVDAMNNDSLIEDEAQPLATMGAMVRADALLKESLAAITIPMLVLHGTADRAAKVSGSQHLHERAGSADKTLRLYLDRYHDPLNDIGKEEVMADILSWIDARLPAST